MMKGYNYYHLSYSDLNVLSTTESTVFETLLGIFCDYDILERGSPYKIIGSKVVLPKGMAVILLESNKGLIEIRDTFRDITPHVLTFESDKLDDREEYEAIVHWVRRKIRQ